MIARSARELLRACAEAEDDDWCDTHDAPWSAGSAVCAGVLAGVPLDLVPRPAWPGPMYAATGETIHDCDVCHRPAPEGQSRVWTEPGRPGFSGFFGHSACLTETNIDALRASQSEENRP